MLRSAIKDIIERLKNPEYARGYGAEMAKTDFALTLVKARKRAGLSQKELADKLGMSQPYIAKLEGGEANPTLETIGAVLAVMGLRLVTTSAPLIPDDVEVVSTFGSTDIAAPGHTHDSASDLLPARMR
jgi:transcriptional regulator with XRE-family HTH domain